MRVALVMPTYFDANSVLAGGERYAWGLAQAIAKRAETALFTFGKEKKVYQAGNLTIHCYKALFYAGGIGNPFSWAHLCDLMNFDVIHCLQFKTLVTDFSIYSGAFFKKKVFVTDLGGGTFQCPSRLLPTEKWVNEFLFISEYNRQSNGRLKNRPSSIIYGGVDTDFFKPLNCPREKKIVYVGRVLRFKGLHDLIEALPEDTALDIVGQCGEPEYLQELKDKSRGKKVFFYDSLPDNEVIEKYRNSMAVVLPVLVDSGYTTAMEAMACGTPVIGARTGSLPEIILDGETGFLVPPSSPSTLRQKIEIMTRQPESVEKMGRAARQDVLARFTWDKTAERCLAAYRSEGSL